ncbi:hypothetical protein JL100_034375 (plasmid) [Skermanella mucosa]|uniref:hypothetical protein n=1 Tax=Skermanella mucosa TaxID=1789672 RepID=UPI00192B1849|nr:hypothetical protein [Skermanella mucosa]UEM24828.1 hypothetical protein JL100_034375 [Skermanella mucosa]
MLTDAPIEFALLVVVATLAATVFASVMNAVLVKASAPEFAPAANSNNPSGKAPYGTRQPKLKVVA